MSEISDRPLAEDDLDPEPLTLFARWFEEARAHGALEPGAAALATAGPDARPSVRMVLTKGFDENGIVFFTNYGSRKAAELEANPHAALLFHWPELGRQVRVEGAVTRVPRAETETYSRSRSRQSQLSALASPQSLPVPSREWLEQRVAQLGREHPGAELPVREDWGGYRLAPAAWEFWQHRPNRLHDRFRYLPEGGMQSPAQPAEPAASGPWRIERLGP